MKIYLLRHGETDWSKAGRLQGHTDIPLNARGVEQITAVGDFFANKNEIIDVIISSPLIRALRSAEIIAAKIGYTDKIIVEPNFIERSFGLGEGLTPEERSAKRADIAQSAESIKNLCERASINKVCEEFFGKTVLIVAHGSIIKAMLTSATNRPYNEGVAIFGTGEFCLLKFDNVFSTGENIFAKHRKFTVFMP
jgi:broad specificity phosphatase PhoE